MSTIEVLLKTLEQDAPLLQVAVGAFWTAVVLDTYPPRCGLASTLRPASHPGGPPVPHAGRQDSYPEGGTWNVWRQSQCRR
ncbi:MAG: hypothetical protein AMJ93_07380 [Anaerolineae bacterium SM23_84]|nr:MAG: hypothetical protein AMJ93_07380 [Anaerolineae bacterium SM23_84]